MSGTSATFARRAEDVGNIIEFGHANLRVPDQSLTTLFYVTGLGLTPDPFLRVGVENMWMNIGTSQIHLPTGPAQVLGGRIGLIVPDLDALAARLQSVRARLADTDFTVELPGNTIGTTCPWGNRFACHAPDPARFGRMRHGMPYLEIDVAEGSAAGVARFYR